MNKFRVPIQMILMLALLLGWQAPTRQAVPDTESALNGSLADVIVMAGSAEAAARAVKAVGGTTLAQLWLVDGVHAQLPASRLAALASRPGIRSVVRNRVVNANGGATFDEYATNKRSIRSTNSQTGTQVTTPVYLPDGGFVAVDQNGRVLFANPDGSLRASLNLPGKPYLTSPVVAPDGTVYVSGQVTRLFALNPEGSIRWEYTVPGSNKFLGGVALGPDGTVFAADSSRFVYAFDPNSGQLLWKSKAGVLGVNKSTPAIGPDGSVYMTTDKGYVYALQPGGAAKWSAFTNCALSLSPVVGLNGEVFVVQGGGKNFFAFDAATGSLRYKLVTSGTLRANPLVGPDGSVYLPSETGLIALNPGGSQRYMFPALGGSFKTTPVPSTDWNTLYLTVEGSNLFAVDAATGGQRWMYVTSGKTISSPVVDAVGEIILGTDANLLDIVSPLGTRADHLSMPDKITQSAAVSPDGSITVRVGSSQLVTIGLPPNVWDGSPDVVPTDNRHSYKMVNPVAVDVGADRLHDTQLTVNSKIRGGGVTIAVIDSGIYFDSETINVLTGRINLQYLGQADFIDTTCALKPAGTVAGIQYADHCFYDTPNRQFSRDGYGHGTHVAGILWNNLTDVETGALMGIAPDANIVSVRVLGNEGYGTYATVIRGLQWVVENKNAFQIRVVNLSLSATAQTPYFADPLNRAVEQAWANGLVVLAAAGNTGSGSESITVPGNDPYVITVGALSEKRTPGYWGDDVLPDFSATGPTLDGFVKPDILAPGTQIISFMYNECKATWAGANCLENSQLLARQHGDYSSTSSLFRMSGTSMATAIASGVAALMLQVNPSLTPDQVKFRLKYSAHLAVTETGEPVYNLLQQGNGRLWAPAAVLGTFPENSRDNVGLDIHTDLAHGAGWMDANQDGLVQYEELDPNELAFHYRGPVGKLLSDDGNLHLYYIESNGTTTVLGVADRNSQIWIERSQLDLLAPSWNSGSLIWNNSATWSAGNWTWGGGNWTWGGGNWTWGGGNWTWGGGNWTWGGGNWTWGGGNWTWGGGNWTWDGGNWTWGGGNWTWGGGNWTWGGGDWTWSSAWTWGSSPSASATNWVGD